MKKYIILIILAAISCVCVPTALVNKTNTMQTPTEKDSYESEVPTKSSNSDTISVFRTLGNETVNITLHEYVCGSVAAEMPLAYHEEALKAQAVACYTNALRLKNSSDRSQKADISDDIGVHQGYIDKEQRREKWGNDFEKYETKLQGIVSSVEGEALYYSNELCVAAFHAISSGNTESSENIWGTAVPYLKSVKSEGDKLSPQYATTVSFSKEDFVKCAEKLNIPEGDIKSLKNCIKIAKKSPSGTVLKAKLSGEEFTGEQIRKAFSLRSPVFTIKTTADTVNFSVSGYGHGVGLSQYGSDYLARQGNTYTEILQHFYTGAKVKKSSE